MQLLKAKDVTSKPGKLTYVTYFLQCMKNSSPPLPHVVALATVSLPAKLKDKLNPQHSHLTSQTVPALNFLHLNFI